jgi:hypothetical protein
MFRVTSKSIQSGLSQLKGHVRGAYTTGRYWAGMLDRAVDMGKRAYNVVKPLLDQSSVGKRVSGGVAKGLMDYDRVRGEVLNTHDKTHSLLGSLKKALPEVAF